MTIQENKTINARGAARCVRELCIPSFAFMACVDSQYVYVYVHVYLYVYVYVYVYV